jgi:hypothetical protein
MLCIHHRGLNNLEIRGGVYDGLRTAGFCMPPNAAAFRYVCAHTPSGY